MNGNIVRVLTWTLATIVAAAIGAGISTFWSQARPSVSIVNFDILTDYNSRFVEDDDSVSVPENYSTLAVESDWASSTGVRRRIAEYSDLMSSLDMNESKMRARIADAKSLESDIAPMLDILKKYERNLARKDDLDNFFNMWERNDGLIWGNLRGIYRRGNFELRTLEELEKPVYKLFNENSDGTKLWIVSNGGSYASFLAPETYRDLPLQEYSAKALAHFSVVDLRRVIQLAREDIENIKKEQELLSEIESTRRSYSRIVSRVLIENSGGSSVAILPFARLEVDASNLLKNGKKFNKPINVALELRDGDGSLKPINIEAGSSAIVSFVSKDFLGDTPDSELLLSAFEKGGVYSILSVFPKGGGYFLEERLNTTPEIFSSLNAIIEN